MKKNTIFVSATLDLSPDSLHILKSLYSLKKAPVNESMHRQDLIEKKLIESVDGVFQITSIGEFVLENSCGELKRS